MTSQNPSHAIDQVHGQAELLASQLEQLSESAQAAGVASTRLGEVLTSMGPVEDTGHDCLPTGRA